MTRLSPVTTSAFLALGIAFIPVAAQDASSPIPSTEVKLRNEIYRDPRLTAYLLEIPPHNATIMHRTRDGIVASGSTSDQANERFRMHANDRVRLAGDAHGLAERVSDP
jgi:hypothetical protein